MTVVSCQIHQQSQRKLFPEPLESLLKSCHTVLMMASGSKVFHCLFSVSSSRTQKPEQEDHTSFNSMNTLSTFSLSLLQLVLQRATRASHKLYIKLHNWETQTC